MSIVLVPTKSKYDKGDPAKCDHPKLQFGSGDYYLFCHDCGRWWATIEPEVHKLWPEGANRGVGAQLSGKNRVAE